MEEMAVEEIMERKAFSQLQTLEVLAVTVAKVTQRMMKEKRIDAQETAQALAAMRERVEKERTKITLEKEKKRLMKLEEDRRKEKEQKEAKEKKEREDEEKKKKEREQRDQERNLEKE